MGKKRASEALFSPQEEILISQVQPTCRPDRFLSKFRRYKEGSCGTTAPKSSFPSYSLLLMAVPGTHKKSLPGLIGRRSLQHFVPVGHKDLDVHLVVVASLYPCGTHLPVLLGPIEVLLDTRGVP